MFSRLKLIQTFFTQTRLSSMHKRNWRKRKQMQLPRLAIVSSDGRTFRRSNGCVQQAAIAEAKPPRYHLCFLAVTFTGPEALALSFT